MSDLDSVIETAISDSEDITPTETTETPSPDLAETPPTTPEDAPDSTNSEEGDPTPSDPSQAPTPNAGGLAEPPKDEFEKKFGIPATGSGGRENRIPYSRVKKIVEKQVKDVEAQFQPKITEYEGKIKGFEEEFKKVNEFRKLILEDPDKFIGMLKELPQYNERLTSGQTAQPVTPTDPSQDMPLPDETMADGTRSYSMEGIKKFSEWTRSQARKEVLDEVQKLYGPIQQEWQAQQQFQKIIPVVQAQIADARKWPLFNESEVDIVKALQSDPKMTLEGAYRVVVHPKLMADRNRMREDILKEIKSAPPSSSVPSTPSRPSVQRTGPRTLEQIIEEQVATLGGK